ncbi:MAG TPA: hypothetical protein VF247_03110 [Candidatus Krumholzibacteria bacterium]
MDIAYPWWTVYLPAVAPSAAVAWAGYLAWRWVRAYERRNIRRRDLSAMSARMRMLEDGLDDVERRMRRSEDVHRFTTSVLAGRAELESRVR